MTTSSTTLERVRFGATGFDVTRVGFGAAEIGLLEKPEAEVSALLNGLLDRGVNLIDTAAGYATSEELIGRSISRRRDEFVLVSKTGSAGADTPEKWTAEAIHELIDRSLKRLQTDRIDVMLLHSCPLDVLERGEAVGALVEAREAGKIRFAGYSGDNEAATYAAGLDDVAVIEMSINLCDQANLDEALPRAKANDIGVLVKRPLANAAWKKLDDQPGMYQSYAATYTQRLQQMKITPESLGFDASSEGDPAKAWPEIALRFVLSFPGAGAHCAIIGSTNPKHIEANIQAAQRGPLPDDVVAKIRRAFRNAEQRAGEPWLGQT